MGDGDGRPFLEATRVDPQRFTRPLRDLVDTFPEVDASGRKNGIFIARMHFVFLGQLEIALQSRA